MAFLNNNKTPKNIYRVIMCALLVTTLELIFAFNIKIPDNITILCSTLALSFFFVLKNGITSMFNKLIGTFLTSAVLLSLSYTIALLLKLNNINFILLFIMLAALYGLLNLFFNTKTAEIYNGLLGLFITLSYVYNTTALEQGELFINTSLEGMLDNLYLAAKEQRFFLVGILVYSIGFMLVLAKKYYFWKKEKLDIL